MSTELEGRLLEILQTTGDQWLDHRAIATHLGRQRNQLTGHDKTVLRRLLRKGVIEVMEHPSSTSGGRGNIYRVKKEYL
jgi:hypothetical protein